MTETKGGAAGYTNDTTEYRVGIAQEDLGAGAMKATTTVTDVTDNQEVSKTEVRSDDLDGKKIAVIPFTNSYSASGDLGGKDFPGEAFKGFLRNIIGCRSNETGGN